MRKAKIELYSAYLKETLSKLMITFVSFQSNCNLICINSENSILV